MVIAENAFSAEENPLAAYIFTVVIPDSVVKIENAAFLATMSLYSITLGSGVEEIGEYAFCYNNKCIEVCNRSSLELTKGSEDNGLVAYGARNIFTQPSESKIHTDENGYVIYEDGEDVVFVAYRGTSTDIVIPNGITEILECAIVDYDILYPGGFEITSLSIPNTVKTIGPCAFYGETMRTVIVPDSVESMGEAVFQECPNLTRIEIGTSLETIEEGMFWGCESLQEVVLPAGLKHISYSAFDSCTSLSSIIFGGTKAEWKAVEKRDRWDHETGDYTVYCTDGNIAKNGTEEGEKYVESEGLEFELNEDGLSYKLIGTGECTDTTVVIPAMYQEKSVTSIGFAAFYEADDGSVMSVHATTPVCTRKFGFYSR